MYAVGYALQLVLTLAADTFSVVSGMTAMFLWITLLVNVGVGLYVFVFNFRKNGMITKIKLWTILCFVH